jgi:hypothetical protein
MALGRWPMELGRSKITARIVASEPAIGVGSWYFHSAGNVGRAVGALFVRDSESSSG